MRQGEQAVSFLLIGSGHAEVTHTVDGETSDVEVGPGLIVGEIALLRDTARSATVIARRPARRMDRRAGRRSPPCSRCPCMMDKLVRTARQRLAAHLAPIPVHHARRVRAVSAAGVARRQRTHRARARAVLERHVLPALPDAPGRPPASLMTYLFEVDYVDHFVWVMTDGRRRTRGRRRAVRPRRGRPDRRRGRVHRRRRLPGPRHRHVPDGRPRGRGAQRRRQAVHRAGAGGQLRDARRSSTGTAPTGTATTREW